MKRLLLAAAGLMMLATSASAQYYPPGPPVFVRPGPPPPPAYYVAPRYVAPRPIPRLTCFVSRRLGGGACAARRHARPGDRCGCPGRYGYLRGRVG
jgi:hypothetical protein